MESKVREASVESKFVRSLLYGMALNLTDKDITRIVEQGSGRVEEMTETDREKLLRQVPKVVRLFGPQVTSDLDPTEALIQEMERLIDEKYLPSILDGKPKFFLHRVQNHLLVVTGQFNMGDVKYSLNGSIGGSKNISSTDKSKMLCVDGKRFHVIRELTGYGPFKDLTVWGWALKLTEGQECRFWINKRTGAVSEGDVSKIKVEMRETNRSGYVRI